MSDFMQEYGAAEEQQARRRRLVKRMLIGGALAVVVGLAAFYYLRTFAQQRVIDHFMAQLEQKNLPAAYEMWCNAAKPCPYYPIKRFEEDWGPSAPFGNPSARKMQYVDYCEGGVLFNIAYPNTMPALLWVERNSGMISFAPPDWQRCPGKHLQLEPLLHKIFGGLGRSPVHPVQPVTRQRNRFLV
ncbi:MAG: hypothetical protein ABI824_14755 [Acidobacteriota bacterium]